MTARKKKAAPKPKAPAKVIDWERIEIEYRAGVKSVRELAFEYGTSHTAINKRAARDGWTRDLKAKVQAKADALVSRAMVSSEVSTETKATEQVVVEVEAQVQARIRLVHRTDIARGRLLAMKLLTELEQQTDNPEAFESLLDLLMEGADINMRKHLLDQWQRAMGLGSRVDTMRKLADTLRVLIDKEREAFSIDAAKGAGADGLPLVIDRDMTGRKLAAP